MSSKRRVCIVLGSLYPLMRGGDEKLFTDIANHITRQREWEFVVLTRRSRKLEKVSIESPLTTLTLDTLRTKVCGRVFEFIYLSFLDQCLFAYKVGLLCDTFLRDFDVVITPDPLVTLTITRRKSRPKLIQFVGGAWAENVLATQPLLGSLPGRIELLAYQRADCTVFMDHISARRFPLKNIRYEIIPSGIDSIVYDPRRYARDELRRRFQMKGTTAILTVATLRRRIKGYEVLLRAIARIIKICPECHFFFAGKGAQEWLSKIARELGISYNLHILGERRDIPELLAASDIFLLPSLSEGTPRALLEAMAMELPCISTSVGGVPDIIRDQHDGRLIEAGSQDAIISSIIDLISDREKAHQMGKNARTKISSKYDLEVTANSYSALIERLLS